MNINIISGQADSNIIMGMVTAPVIKNIYLDRALMSNTDREIYDNFILFFGSFSSLNISNCAAAIDCNRVSTDSVSIDSLELDYLLLSSESKQIVDDFLTLFE